VKVRYEVESWIGPESPIPVDRYWRGWSHRRARRVALKVVASYHAQGVRDFRVAIFDARAKPVTWFLSEDGRYEELPPGSPRLAGYKAKLLRRRPQERS
jgi:hypothetical protein